MAGIVREHVDDIKDLAREAYLNVRYGPAFGPQRQPTKGYQSQQRLWSKVQTEGFRPATKLAYKRAAHYLPVEFIPGYSKWKQYWARVQRGLKQDKYVRKTRFLPSTERTTFWAEQGSQMAPRVRPHRWSVRPIQRQWKRKWRTKVHRLAYKPYRRYNRFNRRAFTTSYKSRKNYATRNRTSSWGKTTYRKKNHY